MTLSLHSHTVYSQRDSIVKPDTLAAKIKANGDTHYSVTDHGTIQGWLALRDACKKHKLTPVYGVELYVNDCLDLLMAVRKVRESSINKEKPEVTLKIIAELGPSLLSPERLQYLYQDINLEDVSAASKKLLYRLAYGYNHLVACAFTEEGRHNLIKLTNLGWTEGYYFKPQVTTPQCIAHATGVIWTSACLGGPLALAWRMDPTGRLGLEYLKQWEFAKQRFFLEVQPLDQLDQRHYNQHLIDLHKISGFPLILSQDNHHVEENDWIAHRILMLSQNDETIEKLEDVYLYQGMQLPFSDLKKKLGKETTWETQQIIREENIQCIIKAGHHYGDAKLHWRTDDDVRRQCEKTNPEILPYLDQCFSVTKILGGIPNLEWEEKVHTPKFQDTRKKVLSVCVASLNRLGLIKNTEYTDWLRREDQVFTACDFYDYVWTLYELTSKVQAEGIPIGYARGSGGGCLVMYLLGIIRVDPVKYGLFFDRFLNPARLGLDPVTLQKIGPISSYPDVDLDFSSIYRKRVIDIAREQFGSDRVIPVGTIGEAKIKTAFQDLCRVANISPNEFMTVSKEIPDDPAKETSFKEAMDIPIVHNFCLKHPIVSRFLEQLVGVMRSTGQHAGGVCIADVSIADNIPVVRAGSKEGGEIVTGFGESGAVRALESIGYIKFDCLATDTVDHISLCAQNRYEEHLKNGGQPWVKEGELLLYPEQMPDFTMDDPAVMKAIFHSGDTDGVFQFEESIGKQLSEMIKPDSVLEVSDISTMIRPGCLQAPCTYTKVNTESGQPVMISGHGLHMLYAATKFNPQLNPPPSGIPEELAKILAPSHYCCIYQEQMMFLIKQLTHGKMSLGQGDLYRRRIEHMGKNKAGAKEDVEALEAEMREKSPYSADVVNKVTTIIKGGANYSFNKSHSLSYSLFSYAQAWFKHYYPHIFYASHITLLSQKGTSKLDKVHKIINNARSRNITISSPHVRWSSEKATWSADGKRVFLPFTVMKGLKSEASKAIQEVGSKSTCLEDFLVAAMLHPEITKIHVTALARVGALDAQEGFASYPRILVIAIVNCVWATCTIRTPEEKIRSSIKAGTRMNVIGNPDNKRLMQWEIEGFGGFINYCPLSEEMIAQMESTECIPLSSVEASEDDQFVYFMITSIVKKAHKSGNSKGKEWFKLQCWDGKEVCDLSIWAYDLDDSFDEEEVTKPDGTKTIERTIRRPGYRSLIKENGVYKAKIRCDGEHPITLAGRSKERHGSLQESLWIFTAK